MRPGRFSRTGFLFYLENLIDVVERDRGLLKSVDITPRQIADRLESIIGQARRIVELTYRGRRESNTLDLWSTGIQVGSFVLRGNHWEGEQECPFVNAVGRECRDTSYASWDYILRNIALNVAVRFPGLAVHLIRDHHFFEGKVSRRVDPLLACRVLQVAPGKDYSPPWSKESIWAMAWGTTETVDEWRQSGWHDEFISAVDNPDSVVSVGDGGHLYFKGDLCVAVPGGECWVSSPLVVNGAIWVDRRLSEYVWGYRRNEHRYVELQESNLSPEEFEQEQVDSPGTLS